MSEPSKRRANELDGRAWTRNSISVWSDIRKSEEELRLGHPAMFPAQLVGRLIDCFTNAADQTVLDPFAGIGSTPLAAAAAGKLGVGVERNPDYLGIARARAVEAGLGDDAVRLHEGDARRLGRFVAPGSADLVVTSPPYWNILTRRRTADYRQVRNYGEADDDLGRIAGYGEFLDQLQVVFRELHTALAPGRYCIINVMDLRRKAEFFPFHMDVTSRMCAEGFRLDDLIIWDRRHEYNSLRPLGYPAVFRVNKVHEFLLIFQKPQPAARSKE